MAAAGICLHLQLNKLPQTGSPGQPRVCWPPSGHRFTLACFPQSTLTEIPPCPLLWWLPSIL